MPFTKKGKERKWELAGKLWCEEGKFEWLTYSQRIYIYASAFMWHSHCAPRKNIDFSQFRSSQCHVGSNSEVKGCVPSKAPWALGTILDSNGRKQYLISCLLQHKVIPHPLGNSGTSQKTNEGKITQNNKFFSSSQPTAQISMPVSENMTPSEIGRLVDVNQINRIPFVRVEIFSSTGLLITLVEFRQFITMTEVKVNQQDELSQFLFCKRRFTDPIATNEALLEGFMFAIGWCKCSTKNEQFGLYQSLGKIENAKDEWRNQGANLTLVGCILDQTLRYVGDNLFQKIQNC
ncbi:hypothetical protein O181_101770 [Austropuccinia psidii MF-1]|uniref:Tet-like 2OG-Fe(II) oxygenase domain-containing protein n=1 Tax=Austropuccinia psidii MF-1 TaxID=1389203 RepID=A0A9Q3PI44_9BASI|nr:hypothetical protein [Austropuccinia psidii MF-1]